MGTVALCCEVHKGMPSARVRIELMSLTMLGQFSVKFTHILRGGICILFAKMTHNGAVKFS